jgi:hypothetical protein
VLLQRLIAGALSESEAQMLAPEERRMLSKR